MAEKVKSFDNEQTREIEWNAKERFQIIWNTAEVLIIKTTKLCEGFVTRTYIDRQTDRQTDRQADRQTDKGIKNIIARKTKYDFFTYLKKTKPSRCR